MAKKSKKIAIGISAGVGVLLLTAMTTLIAPKAVPQTSTDQQNIQDFINISQNNIKTLEYLINTNTNLKNDKKQEMLKNLNQIMSTDLLYRQSFDKDNITQPLNIDINKDRSYKMKYKYYVSYDKQLLYNVNILDLWRLKVIRDMIKSCYANKPIISTADLKTQLIAELSNYENDSNLLKIKNILENDKDNIYIRDIKLALLKNNPIDKLLNAYSKQFNKDDQDFNNNIINNVNNALSCLVNNIDYFKYYDNFEKFFNDMLNRVTSYLKLKNNNLKKLDIVENIVKKFKPSQDDIKNYINSLKDFKFRVPFLEIKRIRLMVDSKDNIKKSSTDGNLHSQKYLDLDLSNANINLTYNNGEWVYKDKNNNVILKAQLTDQSAKSLINKDPIYDIKDFEKTQIKTPTTVFGKDIEDWDHIDKKLNHVGKSYLNTAKDKTFLNNVENINFKELRFENQKNPSDLIDLSILGYKIVKFKFNYNFQGGGLGKYDKWSVINKQHFKDDSKYRYYLVKNDTKLDKLYEYIATGYNRTVEKNDLTLKAWHQLAKKGLIGLGANSQSYQTFNNIISDVRNKIIGAGYDINNIYLDDIKEITSNVFTYKIVVKNPNSNPNKNPHSQVTDALTLRAEVNINFKQLTTIPYATWCNIIDRIPSLKKEISKDTSNKNGTSIESQLKDYDYNNYYSNTKALENYNQNKYKLVNLITKHRDLNDFNESNIINYKDLPLNFEKLNSRKDNVVFLKYVSSKDQLPYEYQYFDSSFSAGNLLKDDKGDVYYIRQVLIAKELFLPEDFRFNKKLSSTDINYNVFKDLGSNNNYNNHIDYSNWTINQPDVNSFEDYEKRVGQEQINNDIQWLKAVQYWLRLLFLTTSVTAKSYNQDGLHALDSDKPFATFFLPKQGYYSDKIWSYYNDDWHNWTGYWNGKNGIWTNYPWNNNDASDNSFDYFDVYLSNKQNWKPDETISNYSQPFRNLIFNYTNDVFPFQGIFNFQAVNEIKSEYTWGSTDSDNEDGKTYEYSTKINNILTTAFADLSKPNLNISNIIFNTNESLQEINVYELGYHWYSHSSTGWYLCSYWRPLYKNENQNLTLYDLANMSNTKSAYSWKGKYNVRRYSKLWYITKAIFNKDFVKGEYDNDKIDDVYKELGFYNSNIISWLRSAMKNRFDDIMTNKVKKLLDLYSNYDYKNMLNANNCVLEDWQNNKNSWGYWEKQKAFTFFKKLKQLFNSELYDKKNNASINDFINKHSYYFDKNINWASDKDIVNNYPNDPKKQLDLDNNNNIAKIYGQNHNTKKLYPYFNNSIFWKYNSDNKDDRELKENNELNSFYIPEEMVDKYNTIVDNFRYNYKYYLTFNKNNNKNYYDQDVQDLYKIIFREMFKLLATNKTEYNKFRRNPNEYIIKYISNFDKLLLQKIQIDNLKSEIKQLKSKFDGLIKDAKNLNVNVYNSQWRVDDNWNKINSNNLNDLIFLRDTLNDVIAIISSEINEKNKTKKQLQELKAELNQLIEKYRNKLNEAKGYGAYTYNIENQWNSLNFDSNDPVELKNIIKRCKDIIGNLQILIDQNIDRPRPQPQPEPTPKPKPSVAKLKAEIKQLKAEYIILIKKANELRLSTSSIEVRWEYLPFNSTNINILQNTIARCKDLIQELKNKINEYEQLEKPQETEDTGTDDYEYREVRSVISRFANFDSNNQDLMNIHHKLNIFNLLWYLDNYFVNDFKVNNFFNEDVLVNKNNTEQLNNKYYLNNKYLLAHEYNPNSLFYTFNNQNQHKLKILKKEFNKTNISDNITNKQEIFNAIKQRIENFNNSNTVNKNYSSKFNDNKHSDRYYINTKNLINNDPELQEFINRIDNIISDDDNRGNDGLMQEKLNQELERVNNKSYYKDKIINPNNDINQNKDGITFKQWLDDNLYYHLTKEIDYLNYYKEYDSQTNKWIDLKEPKEFDVSKYNLFISQQGLISNRIYYKNRLWNRKFITNENNQITHIKLTQLNYIELSLETINVNNNEAIKKVLAKININILRDLINTFLNIKSSNNSDFYNMLNNLSYISSWLTRDLQYYNNSSTKNPCFDNSNKVWYPNMNLLREFRQKHRLYDIDEDDLKTFIMEFITKNNFIKKLKINSLLNYQAKQNNTSNTDNKDQKSTETSSQEIINQYIIDFVKGVYKTNSVDNVYYKYDNMPNQWTMYLENNAIANLTDISNQLHYKKYDFNGMQKYSKGYLNNQALYYKQLLQSYDGIEFLNKKLYNNNADYKDDINNDYLISSITDYIITKSKSKSKNRLYSKIMSGFGWDNNNFQYCQIEDYGIGNVYNKKNINHINKYIKYQNNYFGIYDNITNEMLWNMYNDNNPVKENEIVMQINTEILNDYLNLTDGTSGNVLNDNKPNNKNPQTTPNKNYDDIKGSRLPKVRKTLIKINKDYLVTYGNYKFQFIYRHEKFGDLLFTIAVCYDEKYGQYYKLYVGDKKHIATKNNVIDDIKYLNSYIGNIKNNNDIKNLNDYNLNFNLTKKTDKITKYDIKANLEFNSNHKIIDNDPAWTTSDNKITAYNEVNLEYYEHIWLEVLKNNKIKFINQTNITNDDIKTFISKNINKDQTNPNYAQNYLDLANNLGIYMFINNRILNLYNIVFDLKTMQEHHRLAFKDYANMWSYQEILKEFEVYEKLMLKIGDLGAILTYKNIVYFKETLRAFDYIIKDNQFLDIENMLMANTTKAISEVIKTAFIYIKNNLNALNKLFNEFNKLNILDKSKVLVKKENIKNITRNLYQEYTNINSLVIDKKNLVNVDKNKTKTLLEFSLRDIDLVRNNNGEIIEQTSDLNLSELYKLYNNIINSLEVAYCLNNNNKYKANLLLNNLVKAIYEYKTKKPYNDIGQLNEVNLAYFSDIYNEISSHLKHYEYQYRPSSEFNHSYGSFILTPKTKMEDFEKYKSVKDDDLGQSKYVPNKSSAKEYDFSNTNGIEGFEYNKSSHRSFDISSDNNDGNQTSTPYDNQALKSAKPDDNINKINSLEINKSRFEYDTTKKYKDEKQDYTYEEFKDYYDQLLGDNSKILNDFMKSSFTLSNIKKINDAMKVVINNNNINNDNINIKGIKGNISGCELFRMMTSLYYKKLTDQKFINQEDSQKLSDLQKELINGYCNAIINYTNFYNNKLNNNIQNEINQQFEDKLDGNYLLNNKAMRLKNRHNVFLNNIAIGHDNLLTTLTKYIWNKIKTNTDYKDIDRLLVIYNQAKNIISGFDSSQSMIIQGQNTAYEAGLDNFNYKDILTSLKNTNLIKPEQQKNWISTWFTYSTNILDNMAGFVIVSNPWLSGTLKTLAMAYSGQIETITGIIKLCYNLKNQVELKEFTNQLKTEIKTEIEHNTALINGLKDNNIETFIKNNIFKNMTTTLQEINNNLNIEEQVIDILISIAKWASGISLFNAIFRNPSDWKQANDYMLQYNLGLAYGLWYNLDNVGLFNADNNTSYDNINITYYVANTYGNYYCTYNKTTPKKTIDKENLFSWDMFNIETKTSGWTWSNTYFSDDDIDKYIKLFNLYNKWSNKDYNLKIKNGKIKTINNEYKNNDEYLNIKLLNEK